MANGADHIAAGALTGVAMACYGQSQGENVSPLLVIGASTVFSKLPDWIEPATNPHHRQFFHSISFLAVLGCGLKKTYDWKPEDKGGQILRFLTLCAGAGYISHLVLDCLTPRSLPLIGKV
ncbi:MAG: metal-dependent hydrolase [Cellvibrionaceae bacterium]|uniref:Metal-dependent hydrolase n=1 Tax=Dasania phycosphaerae TaxID=2950436 RepID=A0A9J6RRB6_9GAMM|nr:metal-dependent hydrolase [Dasania phycosphaerae]MCZ0867230.1 metal-dependent hydrolase [Dasania phycosphaerae]